MELKFKIKPTIYDVNKPLCHDAVFQIFQSKIMISVTSNYHSYTGYVDKVADNKYVYFFRLEKHSRKNPYHIEEHKRAKWYINNNSMYNKYNQKSFVRVFVYKIPIEIIKVMGLDVKQGSRNFTLKKH